MSHMPTLMARQPIFDRHKRTIAYELLYRGDKTNGEPLLFSSSDATSATQHVWLNAYTSISKQGKKKTLPAFINMSEDMLLHEALPSVPTEGVVFEIPADISLTNAVVKALKRLKSEGYRTLLDGCTLSSKSLKLLPIMSMAKFDVSAMNEDELAQCVALAQKHHVLPIATKIETHLLLDATISQGFKLFQGFVLSKPKLVKGSQLSANQGALLQLLAQVQDPDVAPEELEKLIIQDPGLTYHFLRIVNSAAYALVRKVESVEEAVVLLGMEQVRRWTTVLSINQETNVPEEVTRMLLMRSAMCEHIAKQQNHFEASRFFMVGMVSGMHTMLGVEQSVLLENLPLSEAVITAVTDYQGELGEVLAQVMAYESGQWHKLNADTDFADYESAYREAIEWTEETLQAINPH